MNEFWLVLSLVVAYSLVVVWYLIFGEKGLIAFCGVVMVLANIEVNILIKAFGLDQTLGNVLFASSFLVTDVLSELYGKKSANKAVNVGILASLTMVILSQIWMQYTPSEGDYVFSSIITIFKSTPRLICASLVVNFVVQKFDVWAYHLIWKATTKMTGSEKKLLWVRNNGSTLISQFLNAVLFSTAAFYGVYDNQVLLSIMLSSYLIFIVTSLADTPVIYLIRAIERKKKAKLLLKTQNI